MSIGKNIQSSRKKKGLTQKELAQKAGLSIASIQGYEQERYVPKYENLQKIADVLEVPIEELNPDIAFDSRRILEAMEKLTNNIYCGPSSPTAILEKKIEELVNYGKRTAERARQDFDIALQEIAMEQGDEIILAYFHEANDSGKDKIIDYAADIVSNPKYQKSNTENK